MRRFEPLILISLLVVLAIAVGCLAQQNQLHRRNAMSLCAWHARRTVGDVSSDEATRLWRGIVSGEAVCPFCGQKHDRHWVSRDAWESQVEAMSQ
jgi:uncharacterized protein (DUF2384 family)